MIQLDCWLSFVVKQNRVLPSFTAFIVILYWDGDSILVFRGFYGFLVSFLWFQWGLTV